MVSRVVVGELRGCELGAVYKRRHAQGALVFICAHPTLFKDPCLHRVAYTKYFPLLFNCGHVSFLTLFLRASPAQCLTFLFFDVAKRTWFLMLKAIGTFSKYFNPS